MQRSGPEKNPAGCFANDLIAAQAALGYKKPTSALFKEKSPA
jgi:hypothetical protein